MSDEDWIVLESGDKCWPLPTNLPHRYKTTLNQTHGNDSELHNPISNDHKERPSSDGFNGLDDSENDDASELAGDEDEDMFDMFTGEVVQQVSQQVDHETQSEDGIHLDMEISTSVSDSQTESAQTADQILNGTARSLDSRLTQSDMRLHEPPVVIDLPIRQLNENATLPFEYIAMSDPQSIRVLEILPAESPGERLSLSLQTTTPTRSYYLAISYTWDKTYPDGSHLTEAVPCDGKLLKMTSRVYTVLNTIRDHLDAGRWTMFGQRPYVWIDAICIDQFSLVERSRQVRLMADIYGKSALLVIWLGGAHEEEEKALLEAVNEHSSESGSYSPAAPRRDSTSQTLRAVLKRSWFSRRWVIQEFAVRKLRTVLLGRVAVDFAPFLRALKHYNFLDDAGPMRDVEQFDSFRPKRWLLTNLHRFQDAKCSIDHDIIYALVHISCGCADARASSHCGLANCSLGVYTIDYMLPFDQLLISLAKQFIRHEFITVLASACIRLDAQSKISGPSETPSWVPNWTVAPKDSSSMLSQYVDRCFESSISDKGGDSFELFADGAKWSSKSHSRDFVPIPNRLNHVITMRGWIMHQPTSASVSTFDDLDWSLIGQPASGMRSFKKHYDIARSGPWIDRHQPNHPRYAEEDSSLPFYNVVPGDWPTLGPRDLVCFLFRYQLAFVIRETDRGKYRLISCVRRIEVLIKLAFVWTQKETGKVWAYGHVRNPPMEFDVV